jgi:F0F1-type ATP synthase membrane subunit b/b'
MPSASSSTATTAPGASKDPYVERREARREAKDELKARKKAAKEDYKAAKKDANAELKASGANSANLPNPDLNTSGK